MGLRVRGKATARPISVEGPTFERVSRVGRGGNRGFRRDRKKVHTACQTSAGGRARAVIGGEQRKKQVFRWRNRPDQPAAPATCGAPHFATLRRISRRAGRRATPSRPRNDAENTG
jgi:hypothetical protein